MPNLQKSIYVVQLGLVFLEWLWKKSYEFPLESISSIVSMFVPVNSMDTAIKI